jgi:hypothetical protein
MQTSKIDQHSIIGQHCQRNQDIEQILYDSKIVLDWEGGCVVTQSDWFKERPVFPR